MAKIKLHELIMILKSDVLKNNYCIEINFSIDNDTKYKDCWMGKMPGKADLNEEIYWYGLVPDGSEAYNYSELRDMLNAKIFAGKSICDVIEKTTWYSLDGCNIEERLPDYITDTPTFLRSAPK